MKAKKKTIAMKYSIFVNVSEAVNDDNQTLVISCY